MKLADIPGSLELWASILSISGGHTRVLTRRRRPNVQGTSSSGTRYLVPHKIDQPRRFLVGASRSC